MALKRVLVFLKTGTFCVYKVEGRETATLEKLQFPKQLKDGEGKSLSQTITALSLCAMAPPKIDSEIFSESVKFNVRINQTNKNIQKEGEDEVLPSSSSSDFEETESSHSLEDDGRANGQEHDHTEYFIAMGLSKGSVVFVHMHKLGEIYARFSVHKQQIEHIQELKQQRCMLTVCAENEMKIWGFEDGRMQTWRKYNLLRPISQMQVFIKPTMLLLSFPSGESYYFAWSNKTKNLRIVLPVDE